MVVSTLQPNKFCQNKPSDVLLRAIGALHAECMASEGVIHAAPVKLSTRGSGLVIFALLHSFTHHDSGTKCEMPDILYERIGYHTLSAASEEYLLVEPFGEYNLVFSSALKQRTK